MSFPLYLFAAEYACAPYVQSTTSTRATRWRVQRAFVCVEQRKFPDYKSHRTRASTTMEDRGRPSQIILYGPSSSWLHAHETLAELGIAWHELNMHMATEQTIES